MDGPTSHFILSQLCIIKKETFLQVKVWTDKRVKKGGEKKRPHWNGFNVSCNRDKCEIKRVLMGELLKCSPLTCQEGYYIWQPCHVFRGKSFSLICRQKGALEMPTTFTFISFFFLCHVRGGKGGFTAFRWARFKTPIFIYFGQLLHSLVFYF